MGPSFQAAQIRYISPHSQVEWMCPSKADKGCRPGAILGMHHFPHIKLFLLPGGMECPKIAMGGKGAFDQKWS